jgi:hypothetical protein
VDDTQRMKAIEDGAQQYVKSVKGIRFAKLKYGFFNFDSGGATVVPAAGVGRSDGIVLDLVEHRKAKPRDANW